MKKLFMGIMTILVITVSVSAQKQYGVSEPSFFQIDYGLSAGARMSRIEADNLPDNYFSLDAFILNAYIDFMIPTFDLIDLGLECDLGYTNTYSSSINNFSIFGKMSYGYPGFAAEVLLGSIFDNQENIDSNQLTSNFAIGYRLILVVLYFEYLSVYDIGNAAKEAHRNYSFGLTFNLI